MPEKVTSGLPAWAIVGVALLGLAWWNGWLDVTTDMPVSPSPTKPAPPTKPCPPKRP